VDRSDTTFVPLPPDTGEIFLDFLIPNTQPLYYFRESGATIVLNDEATINAYLEGTAAAPGPEDNTTVGVFTGYTATTKQEFTGYTEITAPATYVNVTGDTMTGILNTTANLTASGAVTGSSVFGSVSVSSPIINGTTCVQSPLVCATSCVESPVISGGTISASISAFSVTPIVTDCTTCIATTEFVRNYQNTLSGGSSAYFYAECIITSTTSGSVPVKYLSFTGTTMPTGRYQADFTEQVGQSNSNSTVFGRIQVNGVTQGSDFLLKMNVAGFTFTNTLSRDLILPTPTNCFELFYWAGGGTACATFASLRLRKL
jgi:hypothetical protein